jgi:hypothetical protein
VLPCVATNFESFTYRIVYFRRFVVVYLHMSSSYLNGTNKLLILAGISVVPIAFASLITYRYIKSEKTGIKAEEDNDNDVSFVKSDSFYEIGGNQL